MSVDLFFYNDSFESWVNRNCNKCQKCNTETSQNKCKADFELSFCKKSINESSCCIIGGWIKNNTLVLPSKCKSFKKK